MLILKQLYSNNYVDISNKKFILRNAEKFHIMTSQNWLAINIYTNQQGGCFNHLKLVIINSTTTFNQYLTFNYF